MNPKMKSAIEKITLNDATFSNEVIEPTYVNFFYGKNGAGKSTIARTFKANDERLQWQAGKASTDYEYSFCGLLRADGITGALYNAL